MSQRPKLIGWPSTMTLAQKLSKTVGKYCDGNVFEVYDISRQVFPTAPSPTTTHLTAFILLWVSWSYADDDVLEKVVMVAERRGCGGFLECCESDAVRCAFVCAKNGTWTREVVE